MTSSLEGLQSDEQRVVLDTIAQLRKHGLQSVLSLPQLVVCGDQSAGKSSVLEALTEIPFPRKDNLCTRFATEIILRRATTNSLSIKVIPDTNRPTAEQDSIKGFKESITNFDALPSLMSKVMVLMGIQSTSNSNSQIRAFAKDILSIEVEGPSRPQLTLVDLPGLIQTETKGVTSADIAIVAGITKYYIAQPRTICLAVVSATNDYANQGILTKVRDVDPKGERTLGIITKPDQLPSNSESEQAFISLARNEDVIFTLGWHVLKNRSFEEGASSYLGRNASEEAYFHQSNFKTLAKDCVGIDSLRTKLSQLLFDHVKQELPKLREDLDQALRESKCQVGMMGDPRTTPQECRSYLTDLSLEYYDICKAAVDGRYEGDYFNHVTQKLFLHTSSVSIRRLRAVLQYMNEEFVKKFRTIGHKYHFGHLEDSGAAKVDISEDFPDEDDPEDEDYREDKDDPEDEDDEEDEDDPENEEPGTSNSSPEEPIELSHSEALDWVGQVLLRTRGRELSGNFNPLLIGELFWEQSSKWHELAMRHLDEVTQVCNKFVEGLLQKICPNDIRSNLWSFQIRDALEARTEASVKELEKIREDMKTYPMNYNHYYTDLITKQRQARERLHLSKSMGLASNRALQDSVPFSTNLLAKSAERSAPDMEMYSCEEALDCVFSIYKVCSYLLTVHISHILIPNVSRSPKRYSSQT